MTVFVSNVFVSCTDTVCAVLTATAVSCILRGVAHLSAANASDGASLTASARADRIEHCFRAEHFAEHSGVGSSASVHFGIIFHYNKTTPFLFL